MLVLSNLFSVSNKDTHKIITFLGLKLKFKSKKLKYIKHKISYDVAKNLSPEQYPEYLKDWFYARTGEVLNLDNPQTYNEKIQWLKLYDSTPLKTRLADKYLVRDWIKEKIGEEYLIPLLGVWDKFDDINFDELPDKFVLKCNHGSAYNIIVKDKSSFDKEDARKKINTWMNEDFAFKYGLELHYHNIKHKIIAEKYIGTTNSEEIRDYKFLCFNGEVKYIWVDKDRYTNHRRNFYDRYWNLLPGKGIKCQNFDEPMEKPYNFDKMIKFAELLSQDFIHVRVDFYEEDNKLYFGEMTFTSESGIAKFSPESFAYELGNMIKLPIENDEVVNA